MANLLGTFVLMIIAVLTLVLVGAMSTGSIAVSPDWARPVVGALLGLAAALSAGHAGRLLGRARARRDKRERKKGE